MRPLCLWWSCEALPKLDPSPMLALFPQHGHLSLFTYGDTTYSDHAIDNGSWGSWYRTSSNDSGPF